MPSIWCLIFAGVLANSDAPVFSRIIFSDPAHHVISVETIFPPEKAQRRILKLSAELIQPKLEFLDRVYDFQVTNLEGNRLSWAKTAENGIEIQVPESTFFKVTYAYRAHSPLNFGSFLDTEYAVIFPASLLFHDPLEKDTPVTLEFAELGDWTVATSLTMNHLGRYEAPGWSLLASTLLLVGENRKFDFDVNSVAHRWTICGNANLDEALTVKAFQELATKAIALADCVPNRMIDVYSRFQLDQTTLGLVLPNTVFLWSSMHDVVSRNGWNTFLRQKTRGYLRAWLMGLLEENPPSWESTYREREMPSVSWLMDQFFAYYVPVLMVRCGHWTEADLRKELSRQLEAYFEQPKAGDLQRTPFDPPGHQFLPDKSPATDALTVFAFDLFLRNYSQNKTSADDFFRFVAQRISTKTRRIWKDVYSWLESNAGSEGVLFFEQYFIDAKPLPFEQTLEYGGLKISRTEGESGNRELLQWMKKTVDMGVETTIQRGLVKILRVRPSSPAWDVGVSAGDEWIAVSGIRVTRENRSTVLNGFEPGDTVELLLNRNGRLVELQVSLAADPGKLHLISNAQSTGLERQIFESIFHSDGAAKEIRDEHQASQEQ